MPASEVQERLVRRFMRYSAIATQSVAANIGKCLPSSPGQQVLAEMLAQELRDAGLQNVVCDEHATVTAIKPGNVADAPRVGFICHLDTFDCGLSPEVHAQRLHYTGGDVCLNAGKDIWLRAREHPEVTRYTGEDILFTDGTSVLGADDKAGVSAVMEMITTLDSRAERHGDIVVCFVPDEEIGLVGAKHLDLATRFPADFAYTLDSCEVGEVVYECFNAASVRITFTGVSAHPMSAKGVMVNPLLMAMDYMALLDRKQTPECTEGREGYWWFASMQANASEAVVGAMVREHDAARYVWRKQCLLDAAERIRAKYPTGRVTVEMEDVYANIASAIKDDRTAIDVLLDALKAAKVTAKVIPMRGGTDGAVLSARGLLTPNYFTGAHNFHSRYEFLPLSSFAKSYEVTRHIVRLAAERKAPPRRPRQQQQQQQHRASSL